MSVTFVNGKVFDGETIHEGLCLEIDGPHVVAIRPSRKRETHKIDLQGGLLAPGFIDLQVNGGGGVLFNNDPTPAGIEKIIQAHAAHGTTGLLITLISTSAANMSAAADAVAEGLRGGLPGLLGIHFEGPVLNPARRGAHAEAAIDQLQPQHLQALDACRDGAVLLTLAPEQVDDGVIRQLSAAGVHVFCGHSMASFARIAAARQAGLKGFTHLFNAMPPLQGRAPGPVGAALLADEAWCGIIADGHHVDWQAIALAARCKPEGKLFLVTDAMAPAGAPEMREFVLDGEKVHVSDGSCRTADGTLAGSTLTMDVAVKNMVTHGHCTLTTALKMASSYPAACLGMAHRIGALKPGYRADFVVLDDDLAVREVWMCGVQVHPAVQK